jgi:hypothetical protein
MRAYCKICGEKGRIVSRDELSVELAREKPEDTPVTQNERAALEFFASKLVPTVG